MAENIKSTLEFPSIPKDVSLEVEGFIIQLRDLLERMLNSNRYVPGDFHIGGNLICGSRPSWISLLSPNGTRHYIFVEDDGTLKIHSSEPTQNSDGSEVGTQS